MFQAEQQIGSYTLIRKIGTGGFGEVWLAERRTQFVTKKVAIKLPLSEQVNFESIRQEATLWEQASGHPNVLPIIDADIYDGQVAIVSEFAEDGSLDDKLKKIGKMSVKQAVETTIEILKGLEFLHYKQIIHRDIKPQNILLQGETPRLADFGVSRAVQQNTMVSATIVGTDAYMAPEAFEGKRSVQTDIWSVGVVLYQLLTGKLPFPQEHPTERMFAVLLKEPEPFSMEIPPQLQKIVLKALEKDRELGENPPKRYQSTGEMREALQGFSITLSQSSETSNQATVPFTYPINPPTIQHTLPIITDEKPSHITKISPPVSQIISPQLTERLTIASPTKSGKNLVISLLLIGIGFFALLVSGLFVGGYFLIGNDSKTQIANNNSKPSNLNNKTPEVNQSTTDLVTNKDSGNLRVLTELSLPNSTKLQVYPGGIEDKLIKFIQSDEYKNATAESLKEKWFNFDDLNFKFGTTELAPESKRQLDNIVAILKAFPDVKIKIGAYSDKKGDDNANLKLSDTRAKAVKAALDKSGVGAQVPQTEGYGEKFATVAETESDDARKVDRKTAVRLIKGDAGGKVSDVSNKPAAANTTTTTNANAKPANANK